MVGGRCRSLRIQYGIIGKEGIRAWIAKYMNCAAKHHPHGEGIHDGCSSIALVKGQHRSKS